MKVEEFRVAESLDGFRVEREVVTWEEKITPVKSFWGTKLVKTSELCRKWKPVDSYGETASTSTDIVWKSFAGGGAWLLNIKYYKTLKQATNQINKLCAKDYPVHYYIQRPKEEEDDSRENNS